MRARRIGIVALAGVTLYVLAFAIVFDPLSSPCRTREAWIGPKLRFVDTYVDLGKVWEYEGERSFAYSAFQPLCRAWLFANGLA